MSNLIALDWSYQDQKTIFFNGEKFLSKINPKEIDTIITENIPYIQASEYISKGIEVLRVHQNLISEFRKLKGIEKSDKNDSRLIYEYYKKNPEAFKKVDLRTAKITILYRELVNVIRIGVKTKQRKFAYPSEEHELILSIENKLRYELEKAIEKELKTFPINTWLKSINGLGTRGRAGLISFIKDINRFKSVPSLWHYFGLHVVNGKAPKNKPGEQSSFSCQKRAFVLYIIGDSFIKKRTPKYRDIYDKEKEKQLERGLKRGYADNRAKRKMVKVFLKDLFYKWREEDHLHNV